jgi:hypothetical protein
VSFRYVHVDEDGNIEIRTAPTYNAALDEVGPEGWNRVRLDPGYAGFVNDCGHVLPDRYRRNVVGGVLLMAFGAHAMPYAGPVVFTGWDDHYDDIEVCSLDDVRASAIVDMGNAIREALGLPVPPRANGPISQLADYAEWVQITREMAEVARAAPTPSVTFLTDPADLAAYLRGAR